MRLMCHTQDCLCPGFSYTIEVHCTTTPRCVMWVFVTLRTMTTARYRPTWDLALDPLVSCKLCLGEFPLEQMTTITQ
ncbi:hypothetical protein QTP86_008379 [Hemibagrus guttatus]|nr:hypothetical protein QTP86_008379 [Hemibagrus guttatus]